MRLVQAGLSGLVVLCERPAPGLSQFPNVPLHSALLPHNYPPMSLSCHSCHSDHGAHRPRRTDNNLDGVLSVEGVSYPVKLLNLPTVVEAYKTYDEINMVKINDIGQVREAAARSWQS